MTAAQACRGCGTGLARVFVDLGMSPISNALPPYSKPARPEVFYPLLAYVCDACHLVQVADVAEKEAHFHDDYLYHSSFSSSWLEHARQYAGAATERLGLGRESRVVEIGSNDGYLLRWFVERGVPCLGVDPAAAAARRAEAVGVPTRIAFFSAALAREMRRDGQAADLIVANNVLAHVPDLNDAVAGIAALLKPDGTVTVEFPHLLELIRHNQFDTIYHEHYSYFSLIALLPVFARHGLAIHDADRLATHGGSLRIHARHAARAPEPSATLDAILVEERVHGLDKPAAYEAFAERVRATKRDLLTLLIGLKRQGKRIAGYGAPAKATSLLNYCGIGTDFIDFTVDRNPAKQRRLIAGTRIPILAPDAIEAARPDYVMTLPWNLREEIMADMAGIRAWGGKFIVPIPRPEIV